VDNVQSVLEFTVVGLEALEYVQNSDFFVRNESMQDSAEREVRRIDVLPRKSSLDELDTEAPARTSARTSCKQQVIQYVRPDTLRCRHACPELIVIDEAAAMPLPLVKSMLGPYLVFLSSTVTGYEGTGHALQLKLIAELRQQTARRAAAEPHDAIHDLSYSSPMASSKQAQLKEVTVTRHPVEDLRELTLATPIRYASGDVVEHWLHQTMCMGQSGRASLAKQHLPSPAECALYFVNRDALFSYHRLSECFLQRIMTLYSAAHYKNSPNDLQVLADAPAHRLLVLLGPQARRNDTQARIEFAKTSSNKLGEHALPDILAIVQIAFEGAISKDSHDSHSKQTDRWAGDLIPWTLAQHFRDSTFPRLSGIRIIRLATHPDAQNLGYGSRTLQLLLEYLCGASTARLEPGQTDNHVSNLGPANESCLKESTIWPQRAVPMKYAHTSLSSLHTEVLRPRSTLEPLLVSTALASPARLDWVGVSFGATHRLCKFWARFGFRMVYLRQTASPTTGEHTAIVIRSLSDSLEFDSFVNDARRRFVSLLPSPCFRGLDLGLCLAILGKHESIGTPMPSIVKSAVDCPSSHIDDPTDVRTRAERDEHAEADSRPLLPESPDGPIGVLDMSARCISSRVMDSTHKRGCSTISPVMLSAFFSPHDLDRLALYASNGIDHNVVADLCPIASTLVFTGRLDVNLSSVQAAVLIGCALQRRDFEDVARLLHLPVTQILALYNKAIRKISNRIRAICAEPIDTRCLT